MSPFDPEWGEDPSKGAAFADPVWAAALLGVDPAGLGGFLVRAWSGPARDNFLHNTKALLPPGTPYEKNAAQHQR